MIRKYIYVYELGNEEKLQELNSVCSGQIVSMNNTFQACFVTWDDHGGSGKIEDVDASMKEQGYIRYGEQITGNALCSGTSSERPDAEEMPMQFEFFDTDLQEPLRATNNDWQESSDVLNLREGLVSGVIYALEVQVG